MNEAGQKLQIFMTLKDQLSGGLRTAESKFQRFKNRIRRGWKGAALAAAAYFIAIRQGFDAMEKGAIAVQQRKAFKDLAASFEFNSDTMLKKLKEASAGTITQTKLMEQASNALVLGIAPEKMQRLMEISRSAARALGKDVDFMFQSIVTGIGRQSKLVLDNLGIVFRAEDAYKKYAKSLNKAAKDLTETEKKQAFTNATLEAGVDIMRMVNTNMVTEYERLQILKAQWQTFGEVVGRVLLKAFGILQGFIHQLISGIFQISKDFTTSFSSISKILEKYYAMLSRLPGEWGRSYGRAESAVRSFTESLQQQADEFKTSSEKSASSAVEQYDLVLTKVGEVNASLGNMMRNIGQASESGNQKFKSSFDAKVEIATQAVRNIQNAFADFFYQGLTGQLESAKDVFSSFAGSILQMLSQVLAKILLIKALSALAGPGGSIFGVGLDSIFHTGGVVRRAHSGMLARGEVPIIAQSGEGIISRRGMEAIGAQNFSKINQGQSTGGGDTYITINAVDTQSFRDALARNGKSIISIVGDNIGNNGALRKTIRSLA